MKTPEEMQLIALYYRGSRRSTSDSCCFYLDLQISLQTITVHDEEILRLVRHDCQLSINLNVFYFLKC